jgi:hypothetical protein
MQDIADETEAALATERPIVLPPTFREEHDERVSITYTTQIRATVDRQSCSR